MAHAPSACVLVLASAEIGRRPHVYLEYRYRYGALVVPVPALGSTTGRCAVFALDRILVTYQKTKSVLWSLITISFHVVGGIVRNAATTLKLSSPRGQSIPTRRAKAAALRVRQAIHGHPTFCPGERHLNGKAIASNPSATPHHYCREVVSWRANVPVLECTYERTHVTTEFCFFALHASHCALAPTRKHCRRPSRSLSMRSQPYSRSLCVLF